MFLLIVHYFSRSPFNKIFSLQRQQNFFLFGPKRGTLKRIDSQCPELTPTPARLIALLYNCVHHSIWEIAETLIKEHNLKPKTFHEALEIMFTAEQRLSHL